MTPEVIKDNDANTAAATQSPGMQHWVATWKKGGVVPQRDEKDDWGLHNPDHLGIPERKKSPAPARVTGAKPAATTTTAPNAATSKAPGDQPVEKPAAVTPAPDTTSNFTPARPAQ